MRPHSTDLHWVHMMRLPLWYIHLIAHGLASAAGQKRWHQHRQGWALGHVSFGCTCCACRPCGLGKWLLWAACFARTAQCRAAPSEDCVQDTNLHRAHNVSSLCVKEPSPAHNPQMVCACRLLPCDLLRGWHVCALQ